MGGRRALGRSRPLVSLVASLLLLLGAGGAVALSAGAGHVLPSRPAQGDAGSQPAIATGRVAEPAAAGPASAALASTAAPTDTPASAVQGGRDERTSIQAGSPRRPTGLDRLAPPVALVVYVPHQDDELLSMGVLIARHVVAGEAVRVVVLTDGAASSARGRIDARLAALHLPALGRAAFGAARDRELLVALAALGVPETSVGRAGLPDGGLTEAAALAVIRATMTAYPGALHVATSASDGHPDHLALARALEAASTTGASTAWAVARPAWGARQRDPGCRFLADPAVDDLLTAAAAEYLRWDPSAGRYGVAGQSVPGLLAAAATDPRDLLCDRP